MTAHFRFFSIFLIFLCAGLSSRAQLTGTKTVPSTSYPTLKVAIDSLNLYGVGTGGVIINFSPATGETAPTGGYRLGSVTLNASTSAAKTITINGNGNLITAYTGTSSTADGIFYIMGTDYVTINNLNLTDKTANTSTTTRMEWGYSLVKLSNTAPYDGCQHVTINGCTITLNKTYTNTIGIRSAHSIVATTSILSTSGATAASTNSYNNFTGNTISDVTRGISLVGISSPVAVYDKDNKIGGTIPNSGNTITVGGATNTCYGVYTQYDSVITIRNNNFHINGTQGNTAVYEVNLATGVGDLNVTNNLFDVDCSTTSAYIYAYWNSSAHRDPTSGINAHSTHTITGNTVTGNNPTATSGYLYGIYENTTYCKNLIISNNTIKDINWGNGTGYLYLIYDYLTLTPNQVIDNNAIYNIQKTGSSGYIYGFYLYNYTTSTGHLSMQYNVVRRIKNNSYIYAYYNYASYTAPPTGYDGQIVKAKYNVTDSIDLTTSTSAGVYNYWCYNGFDSTESCYNVAKNIQGSNTGTTYIYNYNYGYYGQKLYKSIGNRVENIVGNGIYCYNYLGMYASLCDSNIVENITQGINGSTTGGILNYLGYYNDDGYTCSNNRINKITMAGGYMQNYLGYYGVDADVHHNAITNCNLNGTAYMYNYIGYNVTNGGEYHHNRIDSITQGTSTTCYPWYSYANASGIADIHDNIISNLTTGSTSISLYPYYLLTGGATAQTHFYNNFLTNINFPSGYTGINSIGVNLASAGIYDVYNNTIRINPITGGANYGFTGICYTSTSILDLRNNIINVNVTPAGSGYTVALRRNTGTAGVTPANFLGTGNGNIYYTPNVTNSWLYGEGTSATGMVNTYNLTNDPNFNTPCGLFKSFMGHDQASFTENNLVAGTIPGTYLPTGTSYAEKGAVPTGNPAVVTDFAGVTRGPVADIGALEFTGTLLDNAPPIVSFTPVPERSYCVTTPTLPVTITDNSGVNNTTGTAPRLYFKKSSENNAFGGNTSSTNGWKYVEPGSVSGNLYTFNFDYTLLTSSVGPGDSITYFIIAQDNASTPNTGATIAGFPLCPPTVVLGSAHGPINASPKPHGFRILSTPTFKADGFPGSACMSGSSVITLNPLPVGATVQWQSATMTGAFGNITGATNTSFTTPVNTTTLRYRALIYCGSTVLTTSTVDTFVIANPSILTTAGATRCGYGSLTLSVTGSPFTTGKWYTTATGGTSFHSGNSYTTPNISSTTTYYVSGNTPNASTEMVGIPTSAPYSNTYGDGYGLEMRFRNAQTNFYATTVYPYNASGSFMVELWDSTLTPTGYSAGPFSVSGGSGTTPVVLPLNFNNIPAGRYFLVQTGITGSPYLNFEYMNPTLRGYTWPINSPSGNASIIAGKYSTVTYYYTFFYNNIIGADCESTAPRKSVTATITPAPPITVSSPGTPGICLGTSTTLNVTSPNVSYLYTWTPGPVSGASQTVSPTTSTTYYVTALDPYTGCVDFDSLTLFVNPVPAPPTITPTSPTICGGSSVVLVGSAPPGVAGVATVGTGTTAVSTYPTPFNGVWTGSRTQYLVKAAELTAAGVQVGQITSLAFNSSSTGYRLLNFTIKLANVSMSALPSAISCPASLTTVHYLTTFTPPSSGWNTFNFNTSTFNWTGGDLLVDISHMNCVTCPTSPCVDYVNNAGVYMGTTTYQSAYTIYDDGNCNVTSCTPSGISGAYAQRPNMQIGYRKPSDLNWLNVGGLYKNAALSTAVSLTDTNTVVYASPTVTTAYRAITNAQGCKSAPSAWDTVFVNPAPLVTITPAGPQTICSGQPVSLCIPTGANQSYQWFLNTVAISGANSNCYLAGASGSYTVTATNIITGCSKTSIPTVLTVNVLPTVTATAGGPTTICNGSNVVLTANSSTALAWQWMESGTPILGATGSTYIVTASGSYSVEVTNSFSCKSVSNVVVVTVNTTPGTVTPQGPTSFCTGGSVVLQGPTSATLPLTYQWYNGAGALAGETLSSYTATATGNYYVIVTNTATGCATTSAPIQVTVGAGPSSAINPQGAVNGCQGGTVTLSAVSQPGLCYQWRLNGTPIAGATSATYGATANGSYTVTVTVCATPACNSTSAIPTVVNLNTLPTASVTPTTVTPFCQGGSAVLTGASSTPNATYQWNLNGTPISGATSSTINAVANGTYTVTVTNPTTGCTNASNAVAVTVYPLPVIAVTPATATTFCQGGNVVLNASAGFGTYTWKKNGVTVSTGSSSSYTANTTGLYTVTVNSTNGCAGTSATTSVQVNALPNVATIPTGSATVCQGLTTTFTVPSDTALTYQWYNGSTAIASATTNTYNTGTAGTYTVKVTNTVTGCVATSANIVLAVTTPPIATATAVGSTTFCQDDSVRLNATTGTNLTYQWKFNGNDIVGATSDNYYAKVAGRYSVAVSSAAGCTTLSNSILVTVNPRPAAYITYNTPLEFCEGSAVVLVANPGTGLTYQWIVDGTPISNTSNVNIAATSGLYGIKVTNTYGCSTISQILNVTVYPAPVPSIVRTGSTLQTTTSYTSYQWFFNNVSIGGATNGTYAFTANGAYKVRVVDANGCEGYSNQFFVNNVGITPTAAGKAIRVYPNPSNGIVHIDASVKIRVVLRDVAGKAVLEASDVKEIDLGEVANGMYLLYISDMDGHLLRAEKVTKTNN